MSSASEIPVPVLPKVWMHKPRSQKTDGGFLARFRGAGSWQRRCVYIKDNAIGYSEGLNDPPLKTIALEFLTAVERVPRDKMLKDDAPPHFADFGWSFSYTSTEASKNVVFACEELEVREGWVNALEAFLDARKCFGSAIGNNSSNINSSGGDGVTSGAGGSGGGGGQHQQHATTLAAMASGEAATVPGANCGDGDGGGGGGDDDEDGGTGTRRHTRDQLKRMMGEGEDDDGVNIDGLGLDDDDDDDDEDDDDDDSDVDDDGNPSSNKKRKAAAARQAFFDAPRLQVERQLAQIAQKNHNHIAFKMEKYASYFKDGDTPQDVVFSRSVYKISKKNNKYERDLVLTKTHLYLFALGGLLSSVSAKIIDLDQIVGVVESTENPALFALLDPAWHDVLLTIAPQNSLLGGTENEVKTQLIAHLFVLLQKIVPGRQFTFREAANVPSIIRRSEDDEHQPLRSEEGDKLRVATKPDLYPKFRVHAEAVVYLSCHVQRVNAEMSYSPRIFIVTDGGVYLAHVDGERISKRASLKDISLMKCDSEMHGVFLRLPEMDMVVYATNVIDYQGIVRWVPEAAQRSARHKIPVQASRNLLDGARLMEAKKLLEHFSKAGASTEDTFRAISKLALKAGKASWKFSKSGIHAITKNVENLGRGSVDLLARAGQEVGGMLLDNRLTGELRGLGEQMLSITGAVQARVVSERILTLADVDKYCFLKELTSDTLKMQGTPALAAFAQSHKDIDTNIIYFSARCKHFPLAATLDTSRGSDRFIVLTATGILLFDDPSGSSGSVVTGSKTLLTRAFKSITGGQVGLQLHETIKWHETRGVLRCLGEPNVVGILNNTSVATTLRDVMVRLPNAKLAESFEAHFLNLYGATTTPKEGQGFWKVLPGTYTTPTADHLRHALKGSAFDQDPRIALRIHPLGGDDLRIAVDNMIVDRIRKYGDNSVRFSSLAWRLKTSIVRKDPTQALKAATEQTAEAGSHGAGLDRKLYKQCGLVLTNCSVYQFEDGSKQINRRLELLHIARVRVNSADPDAVLLVVPREFDFFIRIEGRAQEFIDKLVEARNEWSDYELELPVELDTESFLPLPLKDKSKEAAQSKKIVPLPVEYTNEAVFNSGRLIKPKNFSEEQNQISAEIVHNFYVKKLMKFVKDALDESDLVHPLLLSSAQGGAKSNSYINSTSANNAFSDWDTDKSMSNNNAGGSALSSPGLPRTRGGARGGGGGGDQSVCISSFISSGEGTDVILHCERVMSQVRFAVERAFAFGLRPQHDDCGDLARGLTLLEFHRRWREILGRLQRAAQLDALSDFEQGESKARELRTAITQKFAASNRGAAASCAAASSFEDAIQTTIELQSPQLEAMKNRATVKSSIELLIQRAGTHGPEGVLAELEAAVVRAVELGVSLEIVDGFKTSFDSAVQAHRMNRIAAYSWSPPLIDIFNAAYGTSANSSSSGNSNSNSNGNLTTPLVTSSNEYFLNKDDQMTTWALRTLEAAVNNGEAIQLEEEIKATEAAFRGANNDGVIPAKVQEGIARAKDLFSELQKYDPVIQDLKRVSGDFRRRVAHLSCEQLQNFESEFSRIIEQLPSNVASLRAARDTAFVLFSTIQLKRKSAELQEEAILEEKALAAAYSKSANEDAIASAQRYERAQRTKQEAQMKQRKRDIEEIAQRGCDLLFSMKRSVAAEDADAVEGLVKSIDTHLASMEAMLARCISQEEVRGLEESVVGGFRQHLDEARGLGASFVEQFVLRGGSAAVPPDALAAAQRLDAVALCRFVESGELDIASLKILGELWQKAAHQKKELHRLRQRAFVIDPEDESAVESLMSEAQTIGVEKDVVIAKVRESAHKAKRQKQKQNLKLDTMNGNSDHNHNNTNNHNNNNNKAHLQYQATTTDETLVNNASSPSSHQVQQQQQVPQKESKFMPPAIYEPNYYWVSQRGGGIFMDVHGCLSSLFRKPHIVDAAKEPGRYELPKDYFTNDIRDFCTRMENFLSHRVKPAGFFRKTQRSLFDLITEIGKLCRNGEVVAPFCAHLVGEFERVKKLNNSGGLTSDQVLVRLVLSKRDLQRIFDDFSKLNAKERDNLFFEDSVWQIHDDVAAKDLSLLAKMANQIVWPFNFTDRRMHFDAASSASVLASSSSASMSSTTTSAAPTTLSKDALANLAGCGSVSGSLALNSSIAAANDNNNNNNTNHYISHNHANDGTNLSFALSQSIAPSMAASGTVGGAGVGVNCDVAVATLRHAVRLFSSFFQTEMRNLGVDSTPEQRRQIFDETKSKMCGVIVREEVCAAISLLFKSGLKQLGGIMSRFAKRSPWDIVVASTERMRQSAHGLSGIALPEAVDTVLGLTDPALASAGTSNRARGVSAVSRMNQDQLNDVRFRIFICYALNRKILSGLVLNAIFDPKNKSQMEFLHSKFYNTNTHHVPGSSQQPASPLLPLCAFEDEECRCEIAKIFSYFEKLPFVLSLDAEIW